MNTHMNTPVARSFPLRPNIDAIVALNHLAKPVANPERDARHNSLLARLPEAQLSRLLPHFERVSMPVDQVLYQYGSRSQHVYFPTTAIVSLMYEMKDGLSAEVAVVGNEGMIGIGLFMAGESIPGRAQVRCAGHGIRIKSRIIKEEFNSAGPLQHALLCYIQALIVTISQNAVCNCHHTIGQQLCRCLLLNLDRSSGNEVALTQEMIAASLGARRESVTEAAGKLRAQDLIDYRRGHITVLDRRGLESQVCECYAVVKKAFDRLLPRSVETPATGNA
jgi:CRP-like cAMP-binding protein